MNTIAQPNKLNKLAVIAFMQFAAVLLIRIGGG